MHDLSGARVLIVGAGVLGLSVAAEAAARGARCTVFDPAPLGDNASGVAAGMLAPAFESALDPLCRDRFQLLRAARDLWPSFADRHAAPPPDRSGAVWIAPADRDLAEVAAAVDRAGAAAERLDRPALARLAPGLLGDRGVFTPDDWRIEPDAALGSLARALLSRNGELRPEPAENVTAHTVRADRELFEADAVVLCPGPEGRRFADAAPELAALRPIKGEILRFDAAPPLGGVTVRSSDVYLAPGAAGVVAGATMLEGAGDRAVTPEVGLRLRAASAALYPHLAEARATHRAAVRAGTPDGLPLVGRSRTGVWIAAGARRNGWLLAPMVARLIVAGLAGDEPPAEAAALRPVRFG